MILTQPNVNKTNNEQSHTPNSKEHPIELALKNLLNSIEDYREAVITALPNAANSRIKGLDKLKKKIEKYEEKADAQGNIKLEHAYQVKDLIATLKEYDRISNSKLLNLMERSFFIGIFTEYDRFIGNLLDAIYTKKPELYKTLKKEISLSDLIEISNIEDIKRNILEEEIDSFRRGSYVEQFSDLESKFSIDTLKKFDDWPSFIECAQRRNLMTHNGGCVSQQYLKVCIKEGFKFPQVPKIGQELTLGPDYLFDTLKSISKIAFMLTHTLWRKIFPEEVSLADKAMNNSIYFLLEQKRWRTASEFGEFSLSKMMCKETTSILKMIRIVNTSIALKFNKNNDRALQLLNEVDWSATTRDFKLAVAVMKDDFQLASEIMKDIGKNGELVDELAYYQWPLFEDFRGSPQFQSAFYEIYGTEFRDQINIPKIDRVKKIKNKMAKLPKK